MPPMATELDVRMLTKGIVSHIRNGKPGVSTHGVVAINEVIILVTFYNRKLILSYSLGGSRMENCI